MFINEKACPNWVSWLALRNLPSREQGQENDTPSSDLLHHCRQPPFPPKSLVSHCQRPCACIALPNCKCKPVALCSLPVCQGGVIKHIFEIRGWPSTLSSIFVDCFPVALPLTWTKTSVTVNPLVLLPIPPFFFWITCQMGCMRSLSCHALSLEVQLFWPQTSFLHVTTSIYSTEIVFCLLE